MMRQKSISATSVAIHHHLRCELYLHNTYHASPATPATPNSKGKGKEKNGSPGVTETAKATMARGNDWEKALLRWLDEQGLLLRVMCTNLNGDEIQELIELNEGRDHFFVAGLAFSPPKEAFEERFREYDRKPVGFSIAKPDLLEVKKGEDEVIRWRVIDAKSSMDVKTSHHVQIYFYHLCLQYLLSSSRFEPMGTSAVWVPRTLYGKAPQPSFDGLKSISTPLLAHPLNTFFFDKLPRIIHSERKDVKWHLNPLCSGCAFEADCRERSVREGELGSMPNISIPDAEILRSFLSVAHIRKLAISSTDIEDLYQTVGSGPEMERLEIHHASTTKKVRRILKVKDKASPLVNAARTGRVQILNKSVFTLPRKEDIAIILTLVLDPSDNGIAAYCISVFSNLHLMPNTCVTGHADTFLTHLHEIVEHILDLNEVADPPPKAQVYVFSIAERAALQRTLIELALTSDPLDDELQEKIRLCIGALCEGISLLSTSFQPLVLSGALVEFMGKKGGVSNAELQLCLRRLGCPFRFGTDNELRQRIKDELDRLKACTGRGEVGLLPRVVVLKSEIDHILALPVAGYWNLSQCHAVLLPKSAGKSCPTEDEIYSAFVSKETASLESMLRRRTECAFEVLTKSRKLCETLSGSSTRILVNEARVLHSEFMDVCRQDEFRKLFFMQQFEVLAKMIALWQDRIEGCPDAPRLEYSSTSRSQVDGYLHTFLLSSGYVDLPTDKDRSFFGFILTEDTDAAEVPVESLFDDLAVFNLVFPLNRFLRHRWDSQVRTVRERLFVADVHEINVRKLRTYVVLKTFGDINLRLRLGATYRLSPRFVDFNITKTLSTLLEMDLKTPNHPGYMTMHPFLQLFSDPRAFARLSSSEVERKIFLDASAKIHRTLKELSNLDHEEAQNLLLKKSQEQCLRHILKYRLAVIWGPPGTGKTYTISLSLLRLLQVRHASGDDGRYVIFLTAMTHAAIEAVTAKIRALAANYRACGQFGLNLQWLDHINLERILQGSSHPAPSKDEAYIYAGTVFQLYNFANKRGVVADCIVIDEAGQLGLGPAALVLRALSQNTGKVVIAGDSEQLAPILTTQYPQTEAHLFGSILDCLMAKLAGEDTFTAQTAPSSAAYTQSSQESMVVQLTENFRLNPDLGEFISTIYKRSFKPQKTQAVKLARQLQGLERYEAQGGLLSDAKNILVSLSSAMRKRSQHLLNEPKITGTASSTVPELDTRAISLTLVTLNARYAEPEQVGYEMHIRGEALFAAGLVRLLQVAAPDETIFVATPHRVQRQAVKDALLTSVDDLTAAVEALDIGGGESDTKRKKVVVDTIERLQGSEASFVICLFSHTYAGNADTAIDFLLERRRLNVAISRAKQLCILLTSNEVLHPHVRVLADSRSAMGFAFLKAYEDRAWSTNTTIDLDMLLENVV